MILLILLFALTAGAGSPAAEVERLEREWSAAFLRHDTAAIDRIIADDFVGIDGRGVVSHKADELDEAKATTSEQAFQIIDEKLSDVTVRVYGDTAIVNAVNDVKARFNGKDVNPIYRRTTVWIKRRGAWRCVSFHASRIIGTQ